MNEYNTCSTSELNALMKCAVAWGFNKAPELPWNVDWGTLHTMKLVYPDIQMGSVTHHRVLVMCKIDGPEDYLEMWLDVLPEDWEQMK